MIAHVRAIKIVYLLEVYMPLGHYEPMFICMRCVCIKYTPPRYPSLSFLIFSNIKYRTYYIWRAAIES